MKAAKYTRYGSADVLEVGQIPRPEPGQNEVRVQVHATTVSRTDCGMLRGKPALFIRPTMGLLRPRRPVLGMDFSGTIDAVGAVGAVDLHTLAELHSDSVNALRECIDERRGALARAGGASHTPVHC